MESRIAKLGDELKSPITVFHLPTSTRQLVGASPCGYPVIDQLIEASTTTGGVDVESIELRWRAPTPSSPTQEAPQSGGDGAARPNNNG